ncbi:uncharacterized protein LOC125061951 isoform X1 [Pieris napi]|uniref:uncharacterized protein LOC125061951 isoform X1 n=1 Tax=Pieris napi TaxID=78633 RepID=UPI001FBB6B71|nr:uncharacterized protein LOC125061951 isoform X1 [Pieris napi]
MEDKKPFVKRPDVLRKLNAENLHFIERGLLGDLPDRFKPQVVPVRGNYKDLVVSKQQGFLSSCLPVPVLDSPSSDKGPYLNEEPRVSPLKKTFSFREKMSKMNFFSKDRTADKKYKTIDEEDNQIGKTEITKDEKLAHEDKVHKRFWFFRNKELVETREKSGRPSYKRSKSFEFLPRAAEHAELENGKIRLAKNQSYAFGSSDTVIDFWCSNDSLDQLANIYYDKVDTVHLKSIRELRQDSDQSSCTSSSSGLVVNIMKSDSVQDLLDEFDKTVDMFSENYLSDCEPYTKSEYVLSVREKRKSSSFSTLPSPKIVQVTKVNKVDDGFKAELAKRLSARQSVVEKTARRGSVTDWFVLEENKPTSLLSETSATTEANKYRRAQKKPIQRVRRISSTKYWITPEECEVYSRDRRPPLVIPRITQYRQPRRDQRVQYPEESLKDVPAKAWNWSPTSERSRPELERSYKSSSDSPPLWSSKRLGGSTENLLAVNRRPNHLQLPASSSGDSLDVEVREKPGYKKERKSRSMVAPKQKAQRPPMSSPRLMHIPIEATVLYECPVKRTKFSEGGKKSKKNWTDCYMILTPTALVFYKDQRTFYATKAPKPFNAPPSPTAPRAELVLPLLNAHILQCIQMHTRRFTRSLVLTVEHDQYLLQVESEEGAKKLLKCIQNVIYKLGPPALDDRPSPQYQSSNTDLESLGRTPPVSRHATRSKQKTGGSSNEDLSDSTEVSTYKYHVRSKLKKFFAKRPAMEVLVKKGIYKDEPVFGRDLDEVCPLSSPRVPEFVKACVREIESSEENMCTDGLYRASGNLSQVQKIRLEVDQNNFSVIENTTDIHVLTGSLKLFFRELKEPLIPCSMFQRVLDACSLRPRETRIKEFRDIVQALPQCNRDTLKFILEHLLKVTEYSERNRMHTANLAIVFGPTLLWTKDLERIAVDCIQQNNVVDILLNDYKEIFAEENTKGKKKA